MTVYDIGDTPTITGTFTHNGVATDPAGVTVKYRDPAGVVTTLVYGTDAALTKSAVGVYQFNLSLGMAGTWYYRVEDGENVAAEGYLRVRQTNL